MDSSQTSKPPLFFGWYVLAATIFIGMVTTGAQSSFGVFVVPMEKEFGWDRFTVTLAVGLGALVNFVGSSSISRVPGYDKVDTLHSVGLITNVVGSAACLVNPVIGLPMLAASGIATVAAISEKSRRDQQGF